MNAPPSSDFLQKKNIENAKHNNSFFDDAGPAAAKEDDGDDNADDDEDRGADPNPDHCLNGQHLDKEDEV